MTALTGNSTFAIKRGPAGRAIAEPMEGALVTAFQEHVTMERNASASYFAFAIWFAERELRGFSKFFKEESLSEQIHASKFADYLIARGQTVLLQDLPSPKQDWLSPQEILEASFQMEAEVTASLNQLYAMAERASDMRTTVFLDPTIDTQLQSENEFAHLMGRVNYAQNQPSAMLIIDGELSVGNQGPALLA